MCLLIIAYMRVHLLNNKYPMLILTFPANLIYISKSKKKPQPQLELILQFNRVQLFDLNINHEFYIQNLCRMLI